jgi:hypothetical protein
MKVAYAKRNASIMMREGNQVFVPGGSHWAANDPVVLANPELFSDDPRYGMLGQGSLEPDPTEVVESASAAPGERRQGKYPNPANLRTQR